jgi:hypothetical protein
MRKQGKAERAFVGALGLAAGGLAFALGWWVALPLAALGAVELVAGLDG